MMQKQNMACVRKKTFLGISLYEKYRTDDQLVRLFAGGFWREDVNFSSYGESSRQVYFCGIPLWGRRINNNTLFWHLGRNTEVSKLNIAEALENELNHRFGSHLANSGERRHVFVLWANSGEIAMLFSIFMPRLLARMGLSSQDVVFLCTKQYHADMAALYFPEIKTVVAKPKILRHVTQDLKTKTWDVNVFFSGAYFCEFERQAKNSNTPRNCIDWMAHYLKLSPIPGTLTPELHKRLDEFEKAADRKLGSNTDWSNTILISPVSFSCGSLSAEDIATIHDMAVERGFDVIFNQVSGNKTLTFPELLSKARHAAGIIGIRSGLIDYLNCTDVPMFVCYRNFPDRGFNTPACEASVVLKMFSLCCPECKHRITEVLIEPHVNLNKLSDWMNSISKS